MPSISVYFQQELLADLDEIAAERGTSRNRLIVEACQEAVRKRRSWPAMLFDESRFSEEELKELRASREEFEQVVYQSRSS